MCAESILVLLCVKNQDLEDVCSYFLQNTGLIVIVGLRRLVVKDEVFVE